MQEYENYKPTPFYFINDTIERTEIVRQLDIMQETGVSSFFLHIRDGILDQAYGTAIFFENIRFIVEEAAKRGLQVWLYDEDSFPSGNAGGSIVMDFPELQAYALVVDKLKAEEIKNGVARRVLGKVKGLFGYAVYTQSQEERSEKLTDCFGPVRRFWNRRDMDKTYYCDMQNRLFHPHIRAGTTYAETMFEAKVQENAEVYVAYLKPVLTDCHYGTQVDCLNRRTTEEFLKRTHCQYAKYVGEYFGATIPGIFLDEPSGGGVMPYTAELAARFQALWGYDITDYYYCLSSEYTGDGKKVRREYVETINRLFCENFLSPISDWCKANGLLLTGHFYGEEDPLSGALCAQSVYQQTKWMDIPGVDIIGRYVGDREHCALIMGTKIVVSSAVQSGKEKILAECFAINPFNFGYDGLRKTGDWLFALGVNWLVPHAFHYGYGAFQRADAGKSFFYQDRLYSEYLRFSAYAGRVCKLLRAYRQENRVLFVLPSGGFSEEVPFPMLNTGVYPSERAIAMQKDCYAVVRYLCSNQVGWDVADLRAVQNAEVRNGRVVIGKGLYDKVIFIKGGELEAGAYAAMKAAKADCILYDGSYQGFPDGYGIAGAKEDILSYRKYGEDGELLFLYQNAYDFAEIQVPIKDGALAWVYDAEKDETLLVDVKDGLASLGIRGYTALIVGTGTPPTPPKAERYAYQVEGRRSLECEENPQWIYMPPNAEEAILNWDIQVQTNEGIKSFENHKYARLRELIGTWDEIYQSNYVIPYFDVAARQSSAYPCKAVFRAVVEQRTGAEWILFDGTAIVGEYTLFWNGKEIRAEELEKRSVYDAKNVMFKPQWKRGENLLEIHFENAGEFDGVNGEIYLYKNDKKI